MSAQILVIEDEDDLRSEIVEFLIRRHHRPVGCSTLAEAAAALETMTPDAVFSDINLPDGDGVNFCVRTALRFPGTSWLLMSGNDDLLRLGSQLKSIGGEKLAFSIVEKPVPLRLLDRFISGVRNAAAEPPAGDAIAPPRHQGDTSMPSVATGRST
jgi:DNA-binding NtrC family response regulator